MRRSGPQPRVLPSRRSARPRCGRCWRVFTVAPVSNGPTGQRVPPPLYRSSCPAIAPRRAQSRRVPGGSGSAAAGPLIDKSMAHWSSSPAPAPAAHEEADGGGECAPWGSWLAKMSTSPGANVVSSTAPATPAAGARRPRVNAAPAHGLRPRPAPLLDAQPVAASLRARASAATRSASFPASAPGCAGAGAARNHRLLPRTCSESVCTHRLSPVSVCTTTCWNLGVTPQYATGPQRRLSRAREREVTDASASCASCGRSAMMNVSRRLSYECATETSASTSCGEASDRFLPRRPVITRGQPVSSRSSSRSRHSAMAPPPAPGTGG